MSKIVHAVSSAILLLAAAISPTASQEAGLPLLRVYIDHPYFYDILADVERPDGEAWPLRLYAEGKEVGESLIVYDCVQGIYEERVVTEWSGASTHFIAPAMVAFDHLHCGL